MGAWFGFTMHELCESVWGGSQRKVDDITKSILFEKLKYIRTKFRQSVDSGKRSGHGRVVWIHYE